MLNLLCGLVAPIPMFPALLVREVPLRVTPPAALIVPEAVRFPVTLVLPLTSSFVTGRWRSANAYVAAIGNSHRFSKGSCRFRRGKKGKISTLRRVVPILGRYQTNTCTSCCGKSGCAISPGLNLPNDIVGLRSCWTRQGSPCCSEKEITVL